MGCRSNRMHSKLRRGRQGLRMSRFRTDYRLRRTHRDDLTVTAGWMKVLDDSRQEFVSNVSHELKTPDHLRSGHCFRRRTRRGCVLGLFFGH